MSQILLLQVLNRQRSLNIKAKESLQDITKTDLSPNFKKNQTRNPHTPSASLASADIHVGRLFTEK